LEPAQIAIRAPVLGQFDTGTGKLVGILLEPRLQPFHQGKGVSGGAGETDQYGAVLADAAHLAGIALHDRLAGGYLAIAGNDDLAALAHHDDGRGMHFVTGHAGSPRDACSWMAAATM